MILKKLSLFLLLLVTSSCSLLRGDRLPFSLEDGLTSAKECGLKIPSSLQSFNRLYRVRTEYDGKRSSMRMLAQYVAPQRLRLDLMPSAGSFYLLSRIDLIGDEGEFIDYGQKVHVTKKSKDLLKEVLGVALEAEAAGSLLARGIPLTASQVHALKCTADKKFITLQDASVYGTHQAAPQHYFIRSGKTLKFAVLSYHSKRGELEKLELSQMPKGLFVTIIPVGTAKK